MIDPKQIPDEVVEAAARREHDMDFEASGDLHWPAWGTLSDAMRAWRKKRCRAAIAAALNAWEGAVKESDQMGGNWHRLILPLPKDAANE
jgi:hypothetical protein